MKKLIAILDLQYGSTGKGNVAGFIGQEEKPDTIVTAWAPNAGHTSIVGKVAMINTQLANGIQSPNMENLLIGPGSVVNLKALIDELVHALDSGVKPFDIFIHPQASVLLPEDAEAEAKHLFKIGSTMKGSMNAVVRKLSRTHKFGTIRMASRFRSGDPQIIEYWNRLEEILFLEGKYLTCSASSYKGVLKQSRVVLIEGCQGYSLGINSGFYPYCTSRECTLAQALIDCGIPFREYVEAEIVRIIGVARTYPIRVANRYNDEGVQIGTSGPCYPDQSEITWEDIGQKP